MDKLLLVLGNPESAWTLAEATFVLRILETLCVFVKEFLLFPEKLFKIFLCLPSIKTTSSVSLPFL